MKKILSLLSLILFFCQTNAMDRNYTASTPAATIVRAFLNISMTDSIDFIRWQLIFTDKHFTVKCHYGISKPNTNGFMEGGRKVEVSGDYKKTGNYYQLQSGTKTLGLAEWNDNLLHILDAENNLLVGNGGWSYTLNNLAPELTDQISMTANQTPLEDSTSFVGRTPCGIPGIVAPENTCYKLKWLMILYAKDDGKSGTFKISGTPWYKVGGKKGTWKMFTGKNNSVMYQLNDEAGKDFLYLAVMDKNILAFSDANGNLLVGNLDFSFTLNKRW